MSKLSCRCTDTTGRSAIAVWSDFCAVAPSPEARERLLAELQRARTSAGPLAAVLTTGRQPRSLGFDDGVIIPPDQFPLGASRRSIAAAAAERAPLRGTVRVVVVLVDFSDKAMTQTAAHFNDLFFSTGVLPHGSVKEYYKEATGGLVDIAGEVVGPFRMPETLAWYANGNFGIGRPSGTIRARDMANHAAAAADPSVNFGLYDNDGNGFVDAFIVVHAGSGGEATLNSGDIWSHKYTLPTARPADGKQIYAYLTVPEDCRIGVCAHELGHLLFGFPDLYDIDDTSEGVGNWCLMGGGSWNGGGDIPAHPSAWCKVQQGWAAVTNVTTSGTITIPDVKASRNVYRLWQNGGGGPEYFLLENRQRTNYDANLPGDGLLIWHVDENQPNNSDENHYKVGLVQADGKRDLELKRNRGDSGDPYPGSANNTSFSGSSTPNSNSYVGQPTSVSVTRISASGPTMTAVVAVSAKAITKDRKDFKDASTAKETIKELSKEIKDRRDKGVLVKEGKEIAKELKDGRDKSGIKEHKDLRDNAPARVSGPQGYETAAGHADPVLAALVELEGRLAMVEATIGQAALDSPAEPFIGADQRPDLVGTAGDNAAASELEERMARGDRTAKRALDAPPRM